MTEESLFDQAVSLPPADRSALLDRECAGDPELRRRIEALLAADAAPKLTIDSPVDDTASYSGSGAEAGGVIGGRYALVERIGEGGMGEVWVAKQSEPVKRKVALKLIKAGMDTKAVMQRFEAERQALALMDHPNIAKVLDGGMTAERRPFFVMELVNGLPLTRFCDEAKLGIRERLELFASICQAVQHAHQKGIIHRDLKPSNILVTVLDGKPIPKIIDFGVAKAVGGRLTEESLSTQFGAVVGTFEYMSPEQAGFSAADVDTRSDIYSLGVILYELLTGLKPIDAKRLREAAMTEMIRIIREEEPSKPSTRLSTDASAPSLAALRHTEPKKLAALLRGELDWVVMKCLEKERSRRYETANGVARDIQRYLADEPVEARPASAGYRFRKFVRRHRGPVVTAMIALGAIFVLLIGLIGTTAFAYRSMRQANQSANAARVAKEYADEKRMEAENAAAAENAARLKEVQERKYAQAIADFVKNDFLALTSVEGQDRFGGEGLDRNATLLDLLNRAAAKLKERKDLDPRIEAELCWIVGVNYRGAGEAAKGVPFLERALALHRQVWGDDHATTLNSENSLAAAYNAAGQLAKAMLLYEESLAKRKATLGRDHIDTLISMGNLAQAYKENGKLAKAVPLLEETLAKWNATLGPEHRDKFICMSNLAQAYRASGQLDKAMPLYEETLQKMKAQLGPDHRDTISGMGNLAAAYEASGQLAKAVPLFEETLSKRKARLGPDHPDTLNGMNNLAFAYQSNGQLAKAVPLYEETLAKRKATLGPDHRDTLTGMSNLATAYQAGGQLAKAMPLYEESFQKMKAQLGPDHPDTLRNMGNLAQAYKANGQPAKAVPLLEETLAKWKAMLDPDHPDTLISMANLAQAYQANGQLAKAVPLFEETLAKQKAKLGPDHPDTITCMRSLASAYKATGQLAKAVPLFEETLAKAKAKLGPDHPDTLNSMNSLAYAYLDHGQLDKALPLSEETLQKMKAKLGPDHPDTLNSMNNLATAYWELKRLDQSIPLFEETLQRKAKQLGREHPSTLMTLANLGVNYKDAGRLKEAIPLLEEAHRAAKQHPSLRVVGRQLQDAYEKAGDNAKLVNLLQERLAETRSEFPKDSPQLAGLLAPIGLGLLEQKKWTEAEPFLRECLAIREKTLPDIWATFNTKSMLGGALLGQKKYTDAEPLLLAGYEGMKQREKTIPKTGGAELRIPEAIDRLIELYTTTNKPDEVKKWQEERAKYPSAIPAPEKP